MFPARDHFVHHIAFDHVEWSDVVVTVKAWP